MPKAKNLTNQKFGRLTVIKQANHISTGNRYRVAWECLCSCGTTHIVAADFLLGKKILSCGCLHKETITKHAGEKWPEYKAWRSMINRCYKKTLKRFKYWGGRGITVCDRWRFGEDNKHPFTCFIEDIGRRPSTKLFQFSLHRINNDDHYCPGNVKWATYSEQNLARRKPSKEVTTRWSIQKKQAWAKRSSAYKKNWSETAKKGWVKRRMRQSKALAAPT
jgi:hypothetical protein